MSIKVKSSEKVCAYICRLKNVRFHTIFLFAFVLACSFASFEKCNAQTDKADQTNKKVHYYSSVDVTKIILSKYPGLTIDEATLSGACKAFKNDGQRSVGYCLKIFQNREDAEIYFGEQSFVPIRWDSLEPNIAEMTLYWTKGGYCMAVYLDGNAAGSLVDSNCEELQSLLSLIINELHKSENADAAAMDENIPEKLKAWQGVPSIQTNIISGKEKSIFLTAPTDLKDISLSFVYYDGHVDANVSYDSEIIHISLYKLTKQKLHSRNIKMGLVVTDLTTNFSIVVPMTVTVDQ